MIDLLSKQESWQLKDLEFDPKVHDESAWHPPEMF